MNNRDIMLACLNHCEGPVPQWNMGFYNRPTAKKLSPGLIYPSYYFIPEDGEYLPAPLDDSERQAAVNLNSYIGKCCVGVGKGANSSFGHGGPGEFRGRIIERGDNYFKVLYETGAQHYYQLDPHNYHIVYLPVKSAEEIVEPVLPDPNDPARYYGFADDVTWFKEHGEFTHGHINGFFSGLHYFLMDYPEVLMDFHLNPDGMRMLIKALGEWNLSAARHMLDAGVDCITLCDDLGSGESMLISPDTFREFIKSWYIRLNDLVHSYGGRYTHLHSHGNINAVFADLVEVGFDMINPLDPTDGMDLAALKTEYGRKITLVGGLDKNIFEWNIDEQRTFLERVVSVGRSGGGFILMDAGGVSDKISLEVWTNYLELSREIRL